VIIYYDRFLRSVHIDLKDKKKLNFLIGGPLERSKYYLPDDNLSISDGPMTVELLRFQDALFSLFLFYSTHLSSINFFVNHASKL